MSPLGRVFGRRGAQPAAPVDRNELLLSYGAPAEAIYEPAQPNVEQQQSLEAVLHGGQQQSLEAVLFGGDELLNVVGESLYQEALWAIVGGRTRDPVHEDVIAILMPEAANPYDENAISVWVDLKLVGYLSREDAALYREGLLRLIAENDNRAIALHGQIVGGGEIEEEDRLGYLGVFLDHDPADFGLEPHPLHHYPVRTGWFFARGDSSTCPGRRRSHCRTWRRSHNSAPYSRPSGNLSRATPSTAFLRSVSTVAARPSPPRLTTSTPSASSTPRRWTRSGPRLSPSSRACR